MELENKISEEEIEEEESVNESEKREKREPDIIKNKSNLISSGTNNNENINNSNKDGKRIESFSSLV